MTNIDLVSKLIIMRDIYVDSRRRLDPHGNSYTLFLQIPLKNVTKAELISATVPNTMYNITDGINAFVINSTNTYSISSGFYSACNLADTVNKSTSSEYKLIFIQNEGKFAFIGPSEFTVDILSDELKHITGFESNVYSNLATTSNGFYDMSNVYVTKSSKVANMKPCGEYVYLDIDELRRPFPIDAVTDPNTSQSSTIFAVIPMDVNSGSIKTFKEYTDYAVSVEYPKPIDQIDRLTIKWLDYRGNIINFNGVDDNALILRFTESELAKPIEITEEEERKKKRQPTEKHLVFIVLMFCIIFILLIKRK